MDWNTFTGQHDLSLPEWGPYSKRYFGISHRADPERGTRFDFAVVPGLYRRQLGIPDALRPSGYLPEHAGCDLEDYCYRQQLGNVDELYADIAFARLDDHSRLVECRCVNRSAAVNSFGIHFLSMLEAAPDAPVEPVLPAGCRWFDALLQEPLKRKKPRPQDHLVYDALRRGEVRMRGAGPRGGAIEMEVGDTLAFPGFPGGDATLRLWNNSDGRAAKIRFGGVEAVLAPGEKWYAPVLHGVKADAVLEVLSGVIRCAGAVGGEHAAEEILFRSARQPDGESMPGPVEGSWILRFASSQQLYGIWRSGNSGFFRHYRADNRNDFLLYRDFVHQPYFEGKCFVGNNLEEWFDAVIQPLTAAPGEAKTIYAVLCNGGSVEEVEARIRNAVSRQADFPERMASSRGRYWRPVSTVAGEQYLSSRTRMAAVTLTNVVYPVRMKGRFVRHHTPGRCWDSLYTWDSGFIGLGLAEMDHRRAFENLNAYLTEPGDEECAFIHHGSPVPTQIYLFGELMNRFGDRATANYFYLKLRQYYRFLAGRAPGSTLRGRSGKTLLRSWDYFYNSGGWDDYPPQWFVHSNHLRDAAPAVVTSHVIRCAKILRATAVEGGFPEDVAEYDADIAELGMLLQRDSWDPEAGYFSYVRYDEAENCAGILRYEGNVNFNMGLDGASPLLAGICTPEQKRILWEKLESPAHCWTPFGLSAVDRSAPYFRRDGYWNGSIWMPYQWFFWKAALDDGRNDFAWKIAETALKMYENEVSLSRYCYENFSAESGRGGGWHHFSALSTPVLNWFGSYFEPGRLTGGLETRIRNFHREPGAWRAEISAPAGSVLIAVTCGTAPRRVEFSSQPQTWRERKPGTYEITLASGGEGRFLLEW